MRTPVVAANWKMNKDLSEAKSLVSALLADYKKANTEVFIAPPFVFLNELQQHIKDSGIQLAAQNMNAAASGAHTGEISSSMLKFHKVDRRDQYRREWRQKLTELNLDELSSQ